MFSATDWALKRVLKFVLKKSIGRYLQSEPDLEQLDVQLSTGTFELRNVLLKCEAVNSELALEGWSITAGYIGLVRGNLPLTAAAASAGSSSSIDPTAAARANLTLEEVLITVAPTASSTGSATAAAAASGTGSAGQAAAAAAAAETAEQQQQPWGDDFGLFGQVGVLDGIKLIAGGLESLLHRLSLAATNITIRLEVPRLKTPAAAAAAAAVGVGAELILHVDSVHFYDATPQQQQQHQPQQQQQQQQQYQAAYQAAAAAYGAAAAAIGAPQQLAPAAAAASAGTAAALTELVKVVKVTGLTLELLELTDESADYKQSHLATSQLLDMSAHTPAAAAAAGSSMYGSSSSSFLQSSPTNSSGRRNSSSRYMASSSMMKSSMIYSSIMEHEDSPTAAAAEEPVGQQQPQYLVDGLLLGGAHDSIGLGVKVEVRLAVPAAAAADATAAAPNGPHITVSIDSSPLNLVLQPWQLPLLNLLSDTLAAAAAAVAPEPAAAGNAASQQQQEWGRRSVVEELFFPHCEGLVADTLGESVGFSRGWLQQQQQQGFSSGLNPFGSGLLGSPGSGLYNSVTTGNTSVNNSGVYDSMYSNSSRYISSVIGSVYHEAKSVFVGSSSSSSSMLHQTVYTTNSNSSRSSNAAAIPPDPSQQSPQQKQQEQLNTERAAAAAALTWSVRGCIPAATVSLHYHVPTCAAAAAEVTSSSKQQQQQQQEPPSAPPKFVLHCGGLVISADVQGRGCHVTVKCYALEACEHLPVTWGLADQQLASFNPRDLGAAPRVVPPINGTAGFSHQAPSYPTAAAAAAGLAVWPVLVVSGSALDSGRSLPAVQRPSITCKASSHYKDYARSKLVKASADCDVLAATVWITNGLMQRLSSTTAVLQQHGSTSGSTSGSAHKQAVGVVIASILAEQNGVQQQQPAPQQQQQLELPAGSAGADLAAAVHIARVCVVMPLVIPAVLAGAASSDSSSSGGGAKRVSSRMLLLDLHGGSSSSTGNTSSTGSTRHHHRHPQHHSKPFHQQQQPGALRSAAAAAAGGTVLPVLRITSSPAAAAAAGGAATVDKQQQQKQQHLVVEGCLTRVRLFAITGSPQKTNNGSSSSSSSAATMLAAAASKAAATAASSSSKLLQKSGYTLNRLLQRQQQQKDDSNCSSSSNSSSVKFLASCILDACPSASPRPPPAAVSSHNPKAAAAASGQNPDGPDDVPWGSALFVTVTLDPAVQPAAAAVAAAAAMAAAHAKDKATDEDACSFDNNSFSNFTGIGLDKQPGFRGPKQQPGFSGSSSTTGVPGFQQFCQQGSGLIVHIKAPAVTAYISRSELIALIQSATAATPAAATEPPVSRQQQQQQQTCVQVATLLQARMQFCIHSNSSSSRRSHHSKHSYHQQHLHSSGSSSNAPHTSSSTSSKGAKLPSFSSFEVLAEELTVFRVQGLGGQPSAAATGVRVQGLQLLTSQPWSNIGLTAQTCSNPGQMCALLVPLQSKTDGPPGLEILHVSASPSSSNASSRTVGSSSSSNSMTSVLLRGATLSMDPGGLSMDWATQLVEFCGPIAAASSSSSSAVTSPEQQQQQQGVVVVNLQDFAIRFEPRTDMPTSHNSSRMAAAMVLEGAHWTLNPGPNSAQHMLLHSLGFYVAAAAARAGVIPSTGGVGLNPALLQQQKIITTSSSLGPWDVACPVDFHGFSLSGAGYHCIAQEGGLVVLLKPAVPSSSGGSPGMTEIEVTNSHLTGTLRKDTAALAVQLLNQWAAHALLRNPPKFTTGGGSSSRGSSSSGGSSSDDGSNAAAAAAAAGVRSQQQQPEVAVVADVLAAIQDDTFRISHRTREMTNHLSGGSSRTGHGAGAAAPPTTATAASAGDGSSSSSAKPKQQQQYPILDSSVFLSGGWYPNPSPSSNPEPLSPTEQTKPQGSSEQWQQQQQDDNRSHSMLVGADVREAMNIAPTTAAAAAVDVASGQAASNSSSGSSSITEQQQQHVPRKVTDPYLCDWGFYEYDKQQQQRGLSSLVAGYIICQPAAAAAATITAGECDNETDKSLTYYDNDSLLAASIMAVLSDEDKQAVHSPAPVVLDDFFQNPEPEQVQRQEGLAAGTDMPSSGNAVGDDCYYDMLLTSSDEEFDVLSPRAVAEAAAAAARAHRGFSSSSRRDGLGLSAEEPAAAGVWYTDAAAGQANRHAAITESSRSSSEPQATAAAAACDVTGSSSGSTAASKAVHGHIIMQEDYLAPAQPDPSTASCQPSAGITNPGSAGITNPGSALGHDAANNFAGCRATPRGFVSPWSRVLSHPVFQHLLPLNPTTPAPVTRLVCKGLSGMFVLHDRGAVVMSSLRRGGSGTFGEKGTSSRRRGRFLAGDSGGRLEVEVDGVALQMEIYPPDQHHVNRLTVAVGAVEIRDCAAAASATAASEASSSSSTAAGSSVAAAAAAAAAAAKAAAAAARAGQGPRRMAAAAAVAANSGKACGSSSSSRKPAHLGGGSSTKGWSKVLSVRRPGIRGGALISKAHRSSSHPSAPGSSTTAAAVTSAGATAAARVTCNNSSSMKAAGKQQDHPQQQQQPLLGGMLQGWPAAVLAPDSLLPALAIVLETVKPDPVATPDIVEYRLGLAMLPVKLRLNQDMIAFLVAFGGAVSEAVAAVENPLEAAMAAAAAAAAGDATADAAAAGSSNGKAALSGAGSSSFIDGSQQQQQEEEAAAQTLAPVGVQPPFFQKVVIWGTGVCVEYSPRRIDIAALRDGDFLELLNLIPWGGVDLTLKPLRFTGLEGWDGLAAAAAAEWMQYIVHTQAHKFLAGVAPIRSVIEVGGAVAALLAGPAAAVQDAFGGAVTAAARSITGMTNCSSGSSGSNVVKLQQRLRQTAAAVAAASKAAAAANKVTAATGTGRSSCSGGAAARMTNGVTRTPSLQDAMRQSSASFARALLYEALGLGASVAAGAEVVLAGGVLPPGIQDPAGVRAPAGLVQGLRVAAGEVQGGFKMAGEVLVKGVAPSVRGFRAGDVECWQAAAAGVMRAAPAAAAAPVRGLAAAAKSTLLGAQHALGAAQLQQQQREVVDEQQQQQVREQESEGHAHED